MTMRLTKATGKELLFAAALFAAGAGELALCHRRPALLVVLLVATALATFAFWRRRHVVYLYVVGGIIGPCGEMIAVKAGAWAYADPAFLGIPAWLPFAWGLATVLIGGIAETIAKMEAA